MPCQGSHRGTQLRMVLRECMLRYTTTSNTARHALLYRDQQCQLNGENSTHSVTGLITQVCTFGHKTDDSDKNIQFALPRLASYMLGRALCHERSYLFTSFAVTGSAVPRYVEGRIRHAWFALMSRQAIGKYQAYMIRIGASPCHASNMH